MNQNHEIAITATNTARASTAYCMMRTVCRKMLRSMRSAGSEASAGGMYALATRPATAMTRTVLPVASGPASRMAMRTPPSMVPMQAAHVNEAVPMQARLDGGIASPPPPRDAGPVGGAPADAGVVGAPRDAGTLGGVPRDGGLR